jgi:ubiquinone/menaquinone biosynthesis C-methylase UbiE
MDQNVEKSKKRRTWRTKLSEIVVNTTSIPDKIAIKRAKELIEECKTLDYLKDGGKYLDIGTGLGHIVEQIVNENEDKNVKFLAVDPTWKPLKRLRKRAKKDYFSKALFMKAEGEALPIKTNSMDGVSLFFVMHHIDPENQEKIMSEINRVLKEDGMLFLTEDAPENDDEAERNATWDRRLNFEPKDEPHFYKTNSEWLEFFEQHGFEVVENIYFDETSKKKNEGLIRHRSYILKRKSEVKEIINKKSDQITEIIDK